MGAISAAGTLLSPAPWLTVAHTASACFGMKHMALGQGCSTKMYGQRYVCLSTETLPWALHCRHSHDEDDKLIPACVDSLKSGVGAALSRLAAAESILKDWLQDPSACEVPDLRPAPAQVLLLRLTLHSQYVK